MGNAENLHIFNLAIMVKSPKFGALNIYAFDSSSSVCVAGQYC